MVLLLVFMQLTRDLFAIAKFLLLFALRVILNVLRFMNEPGMLSTRGQYSLEAKFCGLGLVGFGLGLVKHWPRSHVSWPRGLIFLCDTLNEK